MPSRLVIENEALTSVWADVSSKTLMFCSAFIFSVKVLGLKPGSVCTSSFFPQLKDADDGFTGDSKRQYFVRRRPKSSE